MWKKGTKISNISLTRMSTFQVLSLRISSAQEQDTVTFRRDGKIFSPPKGHIQLEQKNHTQEFLPSHLIVPQLFIQCSSRWKAFKCWLLSKMHIPNLLASTSTALVRYLGGEARTCCSWFQCRSTQGWQWARQGNFWQREHIPLPEHLSLQPGPRLCPTWARLQVWAVGGSCNHWVDPSVAAGLKYKIN